MLDEEFLLGHDVIFLGKFRHFEEGGPDIGLVLKFVVVIIRTDYDFALEFINRKRISFTRGDL